MSQFVTLRYPKLSKKVKIEIQQFFWENCIEHDESMTALEIEMRLKRKRSQHITSEYIQISGIPGHKILFTPSYFSYLEPIELLWARMKGNIGRNYSLETTLRKVSEKLKIEFEKLNTEGRQNAIRDMIHHVDKVISRFMQTKEGFRILRIVQLWFKNTIIRLTHNERCSTIELILRHDRL